VYIWISRNKCEDFLLIPMFLVIFILIDWIISYLQLKVITHSVMVYCMKGHYWFSTTCKTTHKRLKTRKCFLLKEPTKEIKKSPSFMRVRTNPHHYQMENGLFSEISTIILKKMTLVHTKVSKFEDNPII